jgi:hypothetical protein
MKKTNFVFLVLFLITVFLLSAAGVWAQANAGTTPAFDQQPSVVLDLWNNGGKGKYKDNVRFTNATLLQNIVLDLYGYDEKKKEWTQIGTSTLKYHSDADQAKLTKGVKIRNFRWFAVNSPSGAKFEASAVTGSNDIYITILDKIPTAVKQQGNDAPAFDINSSIVLDLWAKVKGKYEDSLRIENGTTKQNLAFNVWGYNQKLGQWVIMGAKRVGSTEVDAGAVVSAVMWGWARYSPDEVDTIYKDKLDDFRWIAVQSLDDISFDVQISASRDDLYLKIVDKK